MDRRISSSPIDEPPQEAEAARAWRDKAARIRAPPLGRRSLTYGRPGRRSDTRFAMVGVPASAIGQSTTAQRLSIGWTFEKIENGA